MSTSVTELKRSSDVPQKIGKYVIINKVGKGSTGTVYLSHDPYYRRDVAIKVYTTARTSRSRFGERLCDASALPSSRSDSRPSQSTSSNRPVSR